MAALEFFSLPPALGPRPPGQSMLEASRPRARGTVRKRAGSISHGRDFPGVTAPVAVYRYGIVSVPFARTHDPLGGVASFSDFQINATYSHLF